MNGNQVLWWALVLLLFIIAVIAIVFAMLAWSDSQTRQPHRNIVRGDITARENLCVNGNARIAGVLQANQAKVINGELARTSIRSLSLSPVKVISTTGSFQLTSTDSVYRIDTAGSNVLVLLLPLVLDAPGQVFQIMISQNGANNTVQIQTTGGDVFCNLNCSSTNPVYTFPTVAGNADQVILTNDSVNAWFAIAHV